MCSEGEDLPLCHTCSAASLLMARASCSCNSSSPLVCGLACSNSDDALGDVAKRKKNVLKVTSCEKESDVKEC